MSMFSEQDWFEDKLELPEIDAKLHYCQEIGPSELFRLRDEFAAYNNKGAARYRFDRGEIDLSLLEEIGEYQQAAFPWEVNLELAARKMKWEREIKDIPVGDLKEVVEEEIKRVDKELRQIVIDCEAVAVSDVIVSDAQKGIVPDLKQLKGSEYLEIKRNYELMKQDKAFELTNYCPGSYRRALWMFMKYLKNLLEFNNVKETCTANPGDKCKDDNKYKNGSPLLVIKVEIRQKIYDDLKHYFEGNEELLYELIVNNKPIEEKLFFPENQNIFVELFQRLEYNGHISNYKTEINKWIVKYFTFKGDLPNGDVGPVDFNKGSVENILKGDTKNKRVTPPPAKRLCSGWLEFKPYSQLKKEKKS